MSRNVNVREAVEQLMQQVKSAQANQADEQAMDYLQQVYKLVSAHQEPNTLLLSVCFQLGQGTRHQSPPTNAQGYFEQVVDYTAVFAHLAISAQKQVIQAYHELCEIYVLQANPEKHAWAAQQSLHLLDHQTIRFAPEEQLSLYLESYYQLGSVAAKKANLAQQYHHLQAALALINQQVEPPTTVGVVKIYNELGSYFTEKSDHEEAMVFFQKSLNICLENGGRAHSLLGTTYNYIGWSNEHRSQIDKALYYYEKGLHARRYLLGENDPSVAQSYSNMAVCFSHKNNLTETLRLYKKALSIFLYTYGKQRIHPDLVRSYRNLGFAYIETEKFEQAVHYLNLALTQNKAIYGSKHSEVCVVLCHLGNCYTRMEHYEQAAQHYHLAMNAIFHQFNDPNLYATPSIAQFPISERLSLYAIMNKAGVLQKSQQPKFQDLVQKTYTFGLALMDEMRKSISTEGAQVILSKRFFNLYEGAIKACYQRFLASDPPHEEQASLYLNRAFTFTEKSKATALLAALRAEDAKITATIPENYLQEERRLSQAITDVEKNIALALVKNNIETDVQVRAWQNEHFQLKQTHKDLVKELEQAFPEYHFLKYNTQVADVLQVQTQLNADTGLIAYFVGLHSLFVFYVDKQQQHLQAINYEGNLATKVTEMQQAISWMDLDLFAETAHHLYQTLLNPIASFFASKKHLLFIADDYLNYLPFDTLLPSYDATKHTDFFELDYLIKHHSISYHYSATLLLRGFQKQAQTSRQIPSFLGVAPVNFDGSTADKSFVLEHKKSNVKLEPILMRGNRGYDDILYNLPSSALEIKTVFQQFQERNYPAKALLYAAANKPNLRDTVSNYKYLLLSTHGFVNDQSGQLSGIYLAPIPAKNGTKTSSEADHLLYTAEAYHLDLNADLVVLSSCESGIGTLHKGEGMIAINRGFLYAGASNIIFSLFEVPDDSTSQLITQLFSYILAGDNYPIALQKAKLSLLKQNVMTPLDWAGFVLIGA